MAIAIIEVIGVPTPQGSKRIVVNGTARPKMINVGDRNLQTWRAMVLNGVDTWRREHPDGTQGFLAVPLRVAITFRRQPPLSLPKKYAGQWCATTPDLDKLERAVFDALTLSGLIPDDRFIVASSASKVYARPGESVGCTITVATLPRIEVEAWPDTCIADTSELPLISSTTSASTE